MKAQVVGADPSDEIGLDRNPARPDDQVGGARYHAGLPRPDECDQVVLRPKLLVRAVHSKSDGGCAEVDRDQGRTVPARLVDVLLVFDGKVRSAAQAEVDTGRALREEHAGAQRRPQEETPGKPEPFHGNLPDHSRPIAGTPRKVQARCRKGSLVQRGLISANAFLRTASNSSPLFQRGIASASATLQPT